MMEFYILPDESWPKLMQIVNNQGYDAKAINAALKDAEPLEKSKLIHHEARESVMFEGKTYVRGKENVNV